MATGENETAMRWPNPVLLSASHLGPDFDRLPRKAASHARQGTPDHAAPNRAAANE